MRTEPLEPRRIRSPRGAHGWVDLRIFTDGHLQALDPSAALTYLFQCVVGNREGISFWSRPRMVRILNLPPETVEIALQTLVTADLIAATDRIVQVLPVPSRGAEPVATSRPTRTLPAPQSPSPPAARLDPSVDEARDQETKARALIATFYGRREPSINVVRALARSLALKERSS